MDSDGTVIVRTAEGWRRVTDPAEIERVKREGKQVKAPRTLYYLPGKAGGKDQ